MTPNTLGKYCVLQQLDKGLCGPVYLIESPRLKRKLVAKTLEEDATFSQMALFKRERSILSMLNHPHIVTLIDPGKSDTNSFMILEYVEGKTLDQLSRERFLLTPDYIEKLFRQIADGLNYAHHKGVLHLDIKPGNIMIDESGHAKIIDFGVSHLTAMVESVKAMTTAYAAPELLHKEAFDYRSDLYSLALVFLELLTGRQNLGQPSTEMITKKLNGEPAEERIYFEQAPVLNAVFQRALHRDPAMRYPTANAFCEALLQALRDGAFRQPGLDLNTDDYDPNQNPNPLPTVEISPEDQNTSLLQILFSQSWFKIGLALFAMALAFVPITGLMDRTPPEVMVEVTLRVDDLIPEKAQVILQGSRLIENERILQSGNTGYFSLMTRLRDDKTLNFQVKVDDCQPISVQRTYSGEMIQIDLERSSLCHLRETRPKLALIPIQVNETAKPTLNSELLTLGLRLQLEFGGKVQLESESALDAYLAHFPPLGQQALQGHEVAKFRNDLKLQHLVAGHLQVADDGMTLNLFLHNTQEDEDVALAFEQSGISMAHLQDLLQDTGIALRRYLGIPKADPNALTEARKEMAAKLGSWSRDKGREQNARQRPDLALPWYRSALAFFPQNAEIHLELSETYSAQGRYVEAREAAETAKKYVPTNPDQPSLLEGRIYEAMGNTDEAEKIYDWHWRNGDFQVGFRLLRAQIDGEQFEEAEKTILELQGEPLPDDKKDLLILEQLDLLFLQGRHTSVETLAKDFLEDLDHRNNSDTLITAKVQYIRCRSAFRQNPDIENCLPCEQALAVYTQVGDKKKMGLLYKLLGNIYFRQQKLEQGKAYMARALELFQQVGYQRGLAEAHTILANQALNRNQTQEALLHLQEATALAQNVFDLLTQAQIQFTIGVLFSEEGRHRDASNAFVETLKYSKKDPLKSYTQVALAYSNHALYRHEGGTPADLRNARSLYRTGLAYSCLNERGDSELSNSLIHFARLLWEMDETVMAAKAWNEAKSMLVDNEDLWRANIQDMHDYLKIEEENWHQQLPSNTTGSLCNELAQIRLGGLNR